MITGEQVEAERAKRKLSRRELSELTGLSQGQIANIEKGRTPKPKEVEALTAWLSGEATPLAPPTGEPASTDVPILMLTEDDETSDDAFVFVVVMEDGGAGDVALGDDASGSGVAASPSPAPLPIEPVAVPVIVGRRVSNSEVQTFKRCRRKWWLAWYRHLRLKTEKPTGARAIGTWVHLALARHYVPEGEVREDPRDALERVLTGVNTTLTQYATELAASSDDGGFSAEAMVQQFKKDADLARAMIEGYVQWVAESGADSGLRVIAPEQIIATKLELEHTEDVYAVGKLDVRLIRDIDNSRMFMDHKTVGNLTGPVKMIHMNEQMLHYMFLERMQYLAGEGDPDFVSGALYNMLRKSKRTERAKPPFYQRVEVRHNNHEVANYVQHLHSTVTDMLAVERNLRDHPDKTHWFAPPTPKDDCSWSCDFSPVCGMLDDGSRAEDMLSQLYTQVEHLDYYGDSSSDNDESETA